LAVGWGILYILTAIWSWFLMRLNMIVLLQILNNAATWAMGIFTIWFVRWYPQHIALKAGVKRCVTAAGLFIKRLPFIMPFYVLSCQNRHTS